MLQTEKLPVVALLLLILVSCTFEGLSQEKVIQGLVVDRMNSTRVSDAKVSNLKTKLITHSDDKGQFILKASPGDSIVTSAQGYLADTLKTGDSEFVILYLHKNPLLLKEVNITAKSATPSELYNQNRRDFHRVFEDKAVNLNGLDFVTLATLFGKKAVQADSLKARIERDYREAVIDSAFSGELVERLTGLNGAPLATFMKYFRPSFDYLQEMNEYELYSYIKRSYEDFRDHPEWYPADTLNMKLPDGQKLIPAPPIRSSAAH